MVASRLWPAPGIVGRHRGEALLQALGSAALCCAVLYVQRMGHVNGSSAAIVQTILPQLHPAAVRTGYSAGIPWGIHIIIIIWALCTSGSLNADTKQSDKRGYITISSFIIN